MNTKDAIKTRCRYKLVVHKTESVITWILIDFKLRLIQSSRNHTWRELTANDVKLAAECFSNRSGWYSNNIEQLEKCARFCLPPTVYGRTNDSLEILGGGKIVSGVSLGVMK